MSGQNHQIFVRPDAREIFTHKLHKIIEGVERLAEHTSDKINLKVEHFRKKSRVFDLIVDIVAVNVANYEVYRALVELFHFTLRCKEIYKGGLSLGIQ